MGGAGGAVGGAAAGRAGAVRAGPSRRGLSLLGLMVPELGGGRVLEELQDDPDRAGTPVIVVTGKIDAVPGMRDLLGEERVFLKPFAVAELLARVADITGGPGI